jgi:hypothetical protein
MAECPNREKNNERCTCTSDGCPNHALCCECLSKHLASQQLPACCFPPEVEKTYDRSFRKFIDTWSQKV